MHDPTAQFPSVTEISRTKPVAGLPHRCMICDQPILIGEKHNRLVYRLNSALDPRKSVRAVRYHEHCPPQIDLEERQ